MSPHSVLDLGFAASPAYRVVAQNITNMVIVRRALSEEMPRV